LPLLPPPTTNTRADVTLAGTVHSHVPTVEKVTTVSRPILFVDVGTHAAACAGIGIETKRLVNKTKDVTVAILERAALTFMRTNPKITFTSLLE
jgi:hypothetical protein